VTGKEGETTGPGSANEMGWSAPFELTTYARRAEATNPRTFVRGPKPFQRESRLLTCAAGQTGCRR
jgi:hypothetical protein